MGRLFWISDGISLLLDVLTLIVVTLCIVFTIVLFSGDMETSTAEENAPVTACGEVAQ